MPRKKTTQENAKGTRDITQFFGTVSPSQRLASNAPTSQVSASSPVARPAQRNLKLGQIEASSAARPRQTRQKSPDSDVGGEDLLDSGTCAVVALCCAFLKRNFDHLHATGEEEPEDD